MILYRSYGFDRVHCRFGSVMNFVVVLAIVVIVINLVQLAADSSFWARHLAGLDKEGMIRSFAQLEKSDLGVCFSHPATRKARRRRQFEGWAIALACIVLLGSMQFMSQAEILVVSGIAALLFSIPWLWFILKMRPSNIVPTPHAWASRSVGILVAVAINGLGCALLGVASHHFETQWFSWTGIVLIGAGLAMLSFATTPARIIERNVVTYPSTIPNVHMPADAVYLRPFDSTLLARIRWAGTERGPVSALLRGGYVDFEEFLGYRVATAASGPTVSVARVPGRELPPLSSVAWCLPDSQWDETVFPILMDARAIYLTAGPVYCESDHGPLSMSGGEYEVSRLRRWGLLHKCLFVLAPDSSEDRGSSIDNFFDELGLDATPLRSACPVDLILGFGFGETGRLVVYTNSCNDWQSYQTLVDVFQSQREGRSMLPEHGVWAKFVDLELEPDVEIRSTQIHRDRALNDALGALHFRLDEGARRAIANAQAEATQARSASVNSFHLMDSLVGVRLDTVSAVIAETQIPLSALMTHLHYWDRSQHSHGATSGGSRPQQRPVAAPFLGSASEAPPKTAMESLEYESAPLSADASRALQCAADEAALFGSDRITRIHLLLGLIGNSSGPIAQSTVFPHPNIADARNAVAALRLGTAPTS